jgi:hypothetical protein
MDRAAYRALGRAECAPSGGYRLDRAPANTTDHRRVGARALTVVIAYSSRIPGRWTRCGLTDLRVRCWPRWRSTLRVTGQPTLAGLRLIRRASCRSGGWPTPAHQVASIWPGQATFGAACSSLAGSDEASGAKVTGRGRFGAFSPPESVSTRHGHGDFGGIAVGPHGQALVMYENVAGPRRSRLYTALDPDGLGPKGFGRPRLLARTHVNASDRIPAQPGGSPPMPAWPGTPAAACITAGCTRSGPRRRCTAATPTSCSSTPGITGTPGPRRSG